MVEIADELLRGDHRDKPGWWAQAVRNACEQRRWLAAKYNAAYSDKVALTDADGGSIAQRLIEMTDAQRLVWATEMAERARRLLKKPMIDVTPGGRGNEMTPMRPDAQSMG